MTDETRGPAPPPLPENPNLEWLRKQAKRRLAALRESIPSARLADAQFDLASHYGFSSWRALKAHVDALTVEGRLVDAVRRGDAEALAALLDAHPEKLLTRTGPYDASLLHVAATHGQLATVDLLLRRGIDVDLRERGDNTYALHWAAAGGFLDVVRRLVEAGGDVMGDGDDHEVGVIGWATCGDPCQSTVAEYLVRHGARHHIFSAIAMNLADEVRRIVATDPGALHRRMSRNENHQLPLHFAVRKRLREMVSLLLDLGADPLAVDGSRRPAADYATEPDTDRRLMERVRAMTFAELTSAGRGERTPRTGPMDLIATLALHDWETAERLISLDPASIATTGALHLMAKRNDTEAVGWLLAHGADPNARWSHWESEVTALHLAILGGHPDMVRRLLEAGADPRIKDSQHEADAVGWAAFFRQEEVVRMLEAREASPPPSSPPPADVPAPRSLTLSTFMR